MNDKKVALITGAAGGVGRAVALKFASQDYSLALVDIDERGLHRLGEELEQTGCGFLCIPGDIGDAVMLESIVPLVMRKWGRVDTLINNAASRSLETLRSISFDNWNKTIAVCLTAPAFLTKFAASSMEERKTGGVIINISSIMAERAGGYSPAYIACKGAIDSLTRELAVLYGPKGVRVVAVKPGNIQSGLSMDYTSAAVADQANDLTPLGRSGSAAEVADLCFWLSGPEAAYITGTTIQVDGGFSANFNPYSVKKIQFPDQF